jgi:hypothetical protein
VRWIVLAALIALPAHGQGLVRASSTPFHPAGFPVIGAGSATTGGTEKPDCEVESLNDSGATTLRGIQDTACCTDSNGCNVTFDSALNGYSTLTTGDIEWTQDNSTIDCATDTNEGIAFRDYGLRIFADNVIVKNCRFRGSSTTDCPGGHVGNPACSSDCFTLSGQNIVLDHVSGLWCSDEIINVSNHEDFTHGPVKNITVQHSIFGEPTDALSPGGTRLTLVADGTEGPVTFYRNVFKSTTDRGGVECGTEDGVDLHCEMIENVVYDFIYASRSLAVNAGEVLRFDLLRNVYKRGPSRAAEDTTTPEKLPIWVHADSAGQVFFYGEDNVLLDNGAPGQTWADEVDDLTGDPCDAMTDVEGGDPCAMPTTDCVADDCAERTDDPWRVATQPYGSQRAAGEAILRQVVSEAGPYCLETAEARALSDVRNGTRSLPYPTAAGDYPTLVGSCQ